MVCRKCGRRLPEEAVFCMFCGTEVPRVGASRNPPNIRFTHLLERARLFEEEGDYRSALEYYKQMCSLGINQVEAKKSVARLQETITNYVYFQYEARRHLDMGKVQLKRGELVFISFKGTRSVYALNLIRNPAKIPGGFEFIYKNNLFQTRFTCAKADELLDLLKQAMIGVYPDIVVRPLNELERYIVKNYEYKTKDKAVKYYRERTGVTSSVARDRIEELL